jgi:hypothetical protein
MWKGFGWCLKYAGRSGRAPAKRLQQFTADAARLRCFAWPDPTIPDQGYREIAFGRSFCLACTPLCRLSMTGRDVVTFKRNFHRGHYVGSYELFSTPRDGARSLAISARQ